MTCTTSTRPGTDDDCSYIQSRAEMNYDLINEYAQQMRDGVKFEAAKAIAIENGGHKFIYDGAHRFEAAKAAGTSLLVDWKTGTETEAEWLALSANTKHGLRRSTATKQRVTKNALLHEKGAGLSDREIARWCQVDHKTVGKIRKDLVASGEIPQIAEKTVTRNGTEYQQAAKTEPEYVPIWRLERATRAWLEKKWTTPDLKIKALFMIKQGNRDLLNELCNYQRKPHRRQDVKQACNNTLDQITQRRIKAYKEAKAEPSDLENVNLTPHSKSCPKCESTVFYGISACLDCEACEAHWATEAAFTADISIAKGPTPYRYSDYTLHKMKSLICLKCGKQAIEPTGEFPTIHCTECKSIWPRLSIFQDAIFKQKAAKMPESVTRCTTCGNEGEVFYKQLWKCKDCYTNIQEAAAEAQEAPDHTVPTLYCSKCGKETWQKNPPDNPEEILCWHCSPKKAEMTAENEARATEIKTKLKKYATETERKNAAAMAHIKAYKDQVARETTTPHCGACASGSEQWIRQTTRGICPDCLRTLGKAMIEAAEEIKIQN